MRVAATLRPVDRIRAVIFIRKLGIITLSAPSLQSSTASGLPALKSPKRVDTVGSRIGLVLKIPKESNG
jgi:hypothetical protein